VFVGWLSAYSQSPMLGLPIPSTKPVSLVHPGSFLGGFRQSLRKTSLLYSTKGISLRSPSTPRVEVRPRHVLGNGSDRPTSRTEPGPTPLVSKWAVLGFRGTILLARRNRDVFRYFRGPVQIRSVHFLELSMLFLVVCKWTMSSPF
jgi:hypothetical protein